MESRTLGKIYRLIQDNYTRLALKVCQDKEKRREYAKTCRETADLFKHDICRFVDAEAEKACRLLEDDKGIMAHCVYPPEEQDQPKAFEKDVLSALDMTKAQGIIQEALQEAIAESIQETVQEIIQELAEETKQE